MPVYFHDGKILFDNGKIALGEACCCPGSGSGLFSAAMGKQLFGSNLELNDLAYATTDAPGCSALDERIFELVVIQNGGNPIYQEMTLKNPEVLDCSEKLLGIKVRLRCNLELTIREGQECTDQFELQMYYFEGSYISPRNWVRVELGSTLFPLMLVFKVRPPGPDENGTFDYDCCETSEDIVVTVTE